MAAGALSIEWDFLTLVTLWNVYGLPVSLVVVAIVVLIGRRSRSATAVWLDGLRTVRLIGLIHYALALRAVVQLVQELLTMRVMGVAESFANLICWAVAVLVNPFLGLGLWRRRPRARRWAMAWYAFLSLIAIAVTLWRWRYHAVFDPARWPDDLVGNGLPLFLLGVMLLPRIKRVFAAKASPPRDVDGELSGGGPASALTPSVSTPAPAAWTIVSLLCLLLLLIVISTLVVDLADWARRLVVESE
ncbi:MAG: hypothetical protein ACHRXM_27265 [Isosphaerales bacterium]